MPACCVMNRQVAREKARRPSGAAGAGVGMGARSDEALRAVQGGEQRRYCQETSRFCAARQDSHVLHWEAATRHWDRLPVVWARKMPRRRDLPAQQHRGKSAANQTQALRRLAWVGNVQGHKGADVVAGGL